MNSEKKSMKIDRARKDSLISGIFVVFLNCCHRFGSSNH